MIWDWAFAWDILPQIAKAALITIEATALGFILALVLGLILALARRSRHAALSWPAAAFVEFVRSTPLLIQVYFLFFGLPRFGIVLPALETGIVALGVHYSTYASEIYRAGLDNVPRGQWEAATALNFGFWRKMTSVILPQAIPPIVPALGNNLVAMFKDTPLLASIAVLEMLQTAKIIGSETFRYVEPLTIVGIFFLVLSLISAVGIRRLEARLKQAPR